MRKYSLPVQTAILRSLYAFPYMTVKQLTRLLYSPGSRRSLVTPLLKSLFDTSLVLRAPLYSQLYAKEYIYWLATKGRNLLRKQGYPFAGWSEPEKMASFLRSSHFDHYMETTDFLIEATLLPTINTNLTVPVVFHDFTIKRLRRGSVEPDGWMQVHYVSSDKEKYFLIEIDRKTEDEEDFSSKIGMYLYFLDGEYQNLYHNGDNVMPVVITFTSMGKKRAEVLLGRIEQKLRTSYKEEMANIFRVAYTDGDPFVVDMFFQEVWTIPNPAGRKKQIVSIFGG